MAGFSEEDLATLSQSERDIYASLDDDEEDIEESAEEEEEEAQDEEAEEEELPAKKEFIPQYSAEPVDGLEEKLSKISEEKKALRQQYQDGDIDIDEYETKRDEAEAKLSAIREADFKSRLAAEQSQQALKQRWEWEQERFFEDKANKVYKDDPLIGSAFNTAVKQLANDTKNEGKPLGWFLEEADRMTRSRFGAPAKIEPAKKTKPRAEIPPNIGLMPTAELNDTGADEFSHLDKLKGMALERAVARMSPEQRERYLEG